MRWDVVKDPRPPHADHDGGDDEDVDERPQRGRAVQVAEGELITWLNNSPQTTTARTPEVWAASASRNAEPVSM
jgi:hypothetical protein